MTIELSLSAFSVIPVLPFIMASLTSLLADVLFGLSERM